MSSRRVLAALACVALLAGAAAACGDSGGSGGASTGGPNGTLTYANEDCGFGLTYADTLTKAAPAKGDGSASLFDVAFVDTSGSKQADGRYVDGLQVSVYELARPVKAAEVPQLKQEVDTVVSQLLDSLPEARVTEPLRKIRVNGVPGFKVGYTHRLKGTEVTAVSYFLFSGGYEYELTGQASTQDWAALSPTLEAAVHSFRVD